jgi:hypothetical protein
LAPLISIRPRSGLPPLMMIWSMRSRRRCGKPLP